MMVELMLFFIVIVIAVLLATGAEIFALAGLGGSIYGAEQARKAANRQAKAMEKAADPAIREQMFMEELRRGFLEDRERLLERFGDLNTLTDYYLENIAVLREGLASQMERLARDPAQKASARLALADATGANREAARRMISALVGSGAVRGSGVARALAGEEVRRQQETERMMADLAQQEALRELQLRQQASQLRESIVRERFQMPLALEEALANRVLGMGSNIAGLAQAQAATQMQAQQFLAQQEALRAQQLAQGISGLAQAYQQQQMMNRYFDILSRSPIFNPQTTTNTNQGAPAPAPATNTTQQQVATFPPFGIPIPVPPYFLPLPKV